MPACQLKNVKPGALFGHIVANKEEANSLRGALSGQLSHYHGAGSYIATIDPMEDGSGRYKVEALFVGKATTEGASPQPNTESQ